MERGAEQKAESGEHIIVEVGCGTAPYIMDLSANYRKWLHADPSRRYIGLDIDDADLVIGKMIGTNIHSQILGIDKPKRVDFVQADGTKLPFADGFVSEVIFKNVAGDDQIDPQKRLEMLREAARVLKPGGVMHLIEQFTPDVFQNSTLLQDEISRMLASEFVSVRKKEVPARQKATDSRMAEHITTVVTRLKKRG